MAEKLLPYIVVYCPSCGGSENLYIRVTGVELNAEDGFLTVKAEFEELLPDHDCKGLRTPSREDRVRIPSVHDKDCECSSCVAAPVNPFGPPTNL